MTWGWSERWWPPAVCALTMLAVCSPSGAWAQEPGPLELGPETSREGASAEGRLSVGEVQRVVEETARRVAAGEALSELHFADSHDWVQTRSGEWVRGGVDWMRDELMEFDSVEFGALEVHMRDVVAVHAPNADTYVFEDRTALRGPAIITNEEVLVQTEEGVQRRSRKKLWAIVEGGGRELDHWSVAFRLGLSGNRGNSDQVDFNLGFKLTREDRRTLTELGYSLNLGRADGEQNVSRHIGNFFNRYWLSERFFLNPIAGQLLSDKFQDIRFRAQPSAGAGVRFIHAKHAWWNVSLGLGYQYLKLSEPFAAVDNPQHDGIIRLSSRARFDVTGDFYLLLSWVTNFTYTDVGNSNHTGIAKLLFELTNRLSLESAFLFLRTEDPRPRTDGSEPLKNDYWLTLSLSLQLG